MTSASAGRRGGKNAQRICTDLLSVHVVTFLTNPLRQQFSTCGPQTTGGPLPSAWWSARKA